jgi:hypothetical protein
MAGTLKPQLTALDKLVREGVAYGPRQVGPLAEHLRERYPSMMRYVSVGDVEQILHGLERMGFVERRGGGWWKVP